jgi:hypothetical protein
MDVIYASKLTKEDAELIWDSVDIGNKEALNKEEFRMMMALMRKRRSGLRVGPDTVTDWRLEQLKNRRKREHVNVTKSDQSSHKSMMRELQPILNQRVQRMESHQPAKDHNNGGTRTETASPVTAMSLKDWTQRPLHELEAIAKHLEETVMTNKIAEDDLDQVLATQKEELKTLETQEKALKNASDKEKNTKDKTVRLKEELLRMERELNQLYADIHGE